MQEILNANSQLNTINPTDGKISVMHGLQKLSQVTSNFRPKIISTCKLSQLFMKEAARCCLTHIRTLLVGTCTAYGVVMPVTGAWSVKMFDIITTGDPPLMLD